MTAAGAVARHRRTHALGRFPVAERLAEERDALRALAQARFDWAGERRARVPLDGYLRHHRNFYRAPERLVHERRAPLRPRLRLDLPPRR